MKTGLPEVPIDYSSLPSRAADKRCRIEALFNRKFPSPGDPDGTGGKLVAEVLATFPEEDRPFYAMVAAMTYDDYKALLAAQKGKGAGR